MGGLAAADASMGGGAISCMVAGYVATCGLFYFHFCKVKKMKEEGEVGETKIVPFYFVLLSCLVWTAYGVVDFKDDWAVFFLNAAGVLVMVYCIWSFAQLDQAIRLGASIFVPAEFLGVLVLSIVIFTKFDAVDDKKNWLGIIGSIAGTVMYLVSVITDTCSLIRGQGGVGQDVGGDLGGLLASIINTISWCVYGAVYGGKYMVIANAIGLVFCLLQLVIYGCIKLGILAWFADINWADAYTSLGDSVRGLTRTASE